jgi:hypothetical protein
MFEQRIAEDIKMRTRNTYRDDDGIGAYMKPVQVRSSLIDRILTVLGDVMISVGLKLKYRPHASLTTDQAQAPNYFIML